MFSSQKPFVITAPGPTPWALSGPDARIHTSAGDWRWKTGADGLDSGFTALVSPAGAAVLFLEAQSYVQPLPGTNLLVWFEAGWKEPGKRNDRLELRMFDLFRLEAFPDLRAAEALTLEKKHVHHRGGLVADFTFATRIPAGAHAFHAPPEFREIGELLLLGDYEPTGAESAKGLREVRAIFAFHFDHGQVEVLPQPWFNEGDFDFPYQWITRVQRNPATGRIHGDGLRLGSFVLDDSGTRIGKWLDRRI